MTSEDDFPKLEIPDDLDPELLGPEWEIIKPDRPPEPPIPIFRQMTVPELYQYAAKDEYHRNRAVFELLDRASADDSAAEAAAELGQLPLLREDRLLHMVSMTWAVISGLLNSDTHAARAGAYRTFDSLKEEEKAELLAWLKVERLEDWKPH